MRAVCQQIKYLAGPWWGNVQGQAGQGLEQAGIVEDVLARGKVG